MKFTLTQNYFGHPTFITTLPKNGIKIILPPPSPQHTAPIVHTGSRRVGNLWFLYTEGGAPPRPIYSGGSTPQSLQF